MANLKLIDRRGICWLGFLSALVLILMTASINIAQAVVTVDTYTTAGRPAAGTNGRLIRTTDDVRGLWMDTGSLWFSLSGEVVNVKEFGAKGDGTTDDYTAIQNAIDYASYIDSGSNSRRAFPTKVYFPPGVYRVESALVVSDESYITLEGAGKQNTLIYHPDVNDVEGALVIKGGYYNQGWTGMYAFTNRPCTTIGDLAFGSTGGPALHLKAACNVWVHDVCLFSAGENSAYLYINAGGMNLFENVQTDLGANPADLYGGGMRFPGNPATPSGYYSLISSRTTGCNAVKITSDQTGTGTNLPIFQTEMSFVNLRTGGAYSGHAIDIVAPQDCPWFMFGMKFTNSYIKAKPGYAGVHVNGADVSLSNCDITSTGAVTDGVFVESSKAYTHFAATALTTNNARLHLNKTTYDMAVRIDNSHFYNVDIDSGHAPTTLQVMSTQFDAAATGACVQDSGTLSWLANTGTGAPSIGVGGSGEGFSPPNAVFTIAGDANGRANTPVLSLSRLYTGQVSKWNIGVNSDKALTFVDATNVRYPVRFNLGAPTDSLNLSSTGQLGIGTANQTAMSDINGSTGYNQLRMRTSYTPTSSSDTNGYVGDVAWDSTYIYIRTGAGWKRAQLSTF